MPQDRRRPLAGLALALALLAPVPLSARQAPAEARVDSIFARWDRPDSPGCALGVIRDGRFLYRRGYGMANLDYGIPNSPTMVFYIGSVSKQFAAASIALLAQQGRISLDDDIRRYLPEMPDYGTPITVRHLVHHTSGLRDIYTLMELAGLRLEDVFPDEEALALIARQRELNFRPGTDYLYSNSGYFLLSQIVRRVTGKSLREYAQENIFAPLGMGNTHFHDEPDHVLQNRVYSYMPAGRGGYRISYLANFDKIGAGGLYTTVEDLLLWDANFYDERVGGEALHRQMHTRGVLERGDTLAYAFGLMIGEHRGLRTVSHGGSMMGFRAELLRFPDQRFSVATLCNLGTIDPSALARQVAEVYLEKEMKPAPVAKAAASATQAPATRISAPQSPPTQGGAPAPLAPAELAAYAGDFYSAELDATWRIRLEGERLVVARRARADAALLPAGRDAFRAGGLGVRFLRDDRGRVSALTVEAGRVRNIRFVRR